MQAPKATFSPQRPASTIKLCADCKFYKPVITRQSGLCTLCGDIDVVTGKKEFMLATRARTAPLCGEVGKFYVAGPPQPATFLCKQDIDEIVAISSIVVATLVYMVMIGIVLFAFASCRLDR